MHTLLNPMRLRPRILGPGGAFRRLRRREKRVYLKHLLRLDAESRRRRFHRAMSDAALVDWAERVFAGREHCVVGWFRDGVLRGAAEVALIRNAGCAPAAEAAFAVEPDYRRLGVGHALMRRAALYARNRGARRLHVATQRENRAMLRLAMRLGASFELEAAEANGQLDAPPRSVYSICLEWVENEAGLLRWARDHMRRRAGQAWSGLRARLAGA